MSQPRKHHFLPQFYLRNFSTDGSSLHQVEKGSGKSHGCRIKDLAAVRDFHRLDFEDAEDPQAVERHLAQLEGAMSTHLNAILKNGVGDKKALMETIGFVSLQRMRVPAVKKHIENQLEAAVRTFAEAMERKGELPLPPVGLEECLQVANLTIQISNWKCMEMMFDMAFHPDVLNIMSNMRAVVLWAPAGSFVTCDQPVALFHPDAQSPYGVGPATPGVEISVPLSSSALLVLTHDREPNEDREASTGEVTEFNRRAIVMAERYIYAREVTPSISASVVSLGDMRAGFCFDMLSTDGGTLQILRCVPVRPAGA